ncbi:Peptidyl-prolyl cis-trans isomerase fkbp13, chloroplastic [Chamberlinius hualienensis]
MCIGERRRLFVPSRLAYGTAGTDKIPPNSNLIFEIELLNIDPGPPYVNVFKSIDVDSDGLLSRDEVGEYLRKQIPDDVKESPEIPKFDEDKMVEEIFLHEDQDKNGFISHEEFSGPKHDEFATGVTPINRSWQQHAAPPDGVCLQAAIGVRDSVGLTWIVYKFNRLRENHGSEANACGK